MGSITDLYKLGVSKVSSEARVMSFVILVVLLVCSLGVNLLLTRRVGSLNAYIALMKSEGQLAKGDVVPPFTAKDPQGQTVVMDYGGTDLPTVVFVITPTCGWCTRNMMNVRTLAEKANKRYRFVAFSLSPKNLAAYVAEHHIQFPVYTDLPLVPIREYKLGGTPETFVVSPQGEVLKIWSGAFADDLQRDVESYFGVALPGLVEAESAAK
jgi:peroxiredoxin